MFTSTQAFRGLRFLMLLITPLSFDFLRHLSYNVRNGEVCPFPEMNEGKAAGNHHIYHENLLMTEDNRVRQYGKG